MNVKPITLGFLTCSCWVTALLPGTALAQNWPAPAGQVVLDSINRLFINPNPTPNPENIRVLLTGYFASIEGVPAALFSGEPSERTAHFTWSSVASGGRIIPNGDVTAIVLSPGEDFKVYYNPSPNQSWADPGSFSAGQLIATFRTAKGSQATAGPVFLVTRSFELVSSRSFVFKGQTFNFRRLMPHGFTLSVLGSSVPLAGSATASFPLVFAVAGSGFAIGGELSSMPR